MENIKQAQLAKLKHYIKTFNVKYTDISKALDLDNSTIGKYFNNGTRMSTTRYLEILQVLRSLAVNDEMKLYLIDNWLKLETVEQKKKGLKQLANDLEALSLELNSLIGE